VRDAHRGRSGFTIIEILVVIVVIAILASLVAPNVSRHVGTAKDATARAQIEMLGAALDAYRLDNGRYPTSEQGLPLSGSNRPARSQSAVSALWQRCQRPLPQSLAADKILKFHAVVREQVLCDNMEGQSCGLS